jgi:hypothetical protein
MRSDPEVLWKNCGQRNEYKSDMIYSGAFLRGTEPVGLSSPEDKDWKIKP